MSVYKKIKGYVTKLVSEIELDTEPTEGSLNAITSNAVHAAVSELETKLDALEERVAALEE